MNHNWLWFVRFRQR